MGTSNTREDSNKSRYVRLLQEYNGLLQMKPKMAIKTPEMLSLIYTPGVAESCLHIKNDQSMIYKQTNFGNSLALVTDGSGYNARLENGAFLPANAAVPHLEATSLFLKAT
jgi:malate dehydrogenase (oxaloacetate-decarboxylating)